MSSVRVKGTSHATTLGSPEAPRHSRASFRTPTLSWRRKRRSAGEGRVLLPHELAEHPLELRVAGRLQLELIEQGFREDERSRLRVTPGPQETARTRALARMEALAGLDDGGLRCRTDLLVRIEQQSPQGIECAIRSGTTQPRDGLEAQRMLRLMRNSLHRLEDMIRNGGLKAGEQGRVGHGKREQVQRRPGLIVHGSSGVFFERGEHAQGLLTPQQLIVGGRPSRGQAGAEEGDGPCSSHASERLEAGPGLGVETIEDVLLGLRVLQVSEGLDHLGPQRSGLCTRRSSRSRPAASEPSNSRRSAR